MPTKGGPAGKLGDQYEALLTVHVALRVVIGDARFVTYESLDMELSRGVEFSVQTSEGDVEFWSLKRQTTTAAGWTLATLVKTDKHGRSILGDLVGHAERSDRNVAVFASTLGAAKLEELRAASGTQLSFKQRLEHSRELREEYEKHVLPIFSGNAERARQFLTRLQIRTSDEMSLRTNLESMIALLFYQESGRSIDTAAVRRLLAEYLLDHMHQQIDANMLLERLATERIRRKDWKVDTAVRAKIANHCDAYTKPLMDSLIGGMLQYLPGAEDLVGADGLPIARRTLISADAGGGKSTELAKFVEQLRAAGVPVLAIRMDVIDESVLTPQRLGETLSLPESPVTVLAGLADGAKCVLVIDQLDAVSLASGRRTDVWSLFERLVMESDVYPNLQLIVACREFDLEHDYRMRTLKAQSSGFKHVKIGAFDITTLDAILGERKVHPKLKPLLAIPLHLSLFLSLDRDQSEVLENRDELFGAFWLAKQRKTSHRLGRSCDFTGVIDRLTQRLSEHQELSAPAHILDDVRGDADALTSERVLVLSEGRYRFFHESFFDYAFARRFTQKGGHLVGVLLSDEQHLFRRAQVRQVLSFLRSNDPSRYTSELHSVVFSFQVRFHIKRVIFQFLSALVEPTSHEWIMLRDLVNARTDLSGHVNSVISNSVGWFDTIDAAGFFDQSLSSGDEQEESRAILLLAEPAILESRSARVAELLIVHRRSGDAWYRYLQQVCRNGRLFYSREMFDLFLSLINDGTLDGARPEFALNDNWWSTLYSAAEEAPAMACEAIAAWLDRKLVTWRPAQSDSRLPDVPNAPVDANDVDAAISAPITLFLQHLDSDGDDQGIILKASRAVLPFIERMLPRILSFVTENAKPCGDRLDIDPFWSFRSYGDRIHQVHDALFVSLARALESLARSSSCDLDRLLDPIVARPYDSIAYLVIRAWSAAPDVYADRLARYMIEDPRRLKVGYSSWGGGSCGEGVGSYYRSIEAVRVASQSCSSETLANLENTILCLRDEWESRHPQWRGLGQLQLLTAITPRRLGPRSRSKLAELRAKFPSVTHEPPRAMEVVCVGSPIPANALEKMTDEQWLSAMAAYAGVDHRHDRDLEASGGEHQLAQALESKTKEDPKRFVALSAKMSADLPFSYFDAIIMGIADTQPPDDASTADVSLSDVIALVEQAHTLPGRPCGRWISRLVEKWSKTAWPKSIIEMIAWYAINDPDPAEELWHGRADGGQSYYGGDPDFCGLNSTRGAAAHAIARLLFDGRELEDSLVNAVESLAHDNSIAVRSQAIYALLALLDRRFDLAIPWFIKCVSADAILLKTRLIEEFVYRAGYRNYAAIRPVLQIMLASSDVQTVKTGAQLCCLLALDVDVTDADACQVRSGNSSMRLGAATVYATNVAHRDVGMRCRELLIPFFRDTDDTVREEAAKAFRHIPELGRAEQGELLAAFLDAEPKAPALGSVVWAVEGSALRLPDLVCRLVESALEEYRTATGDIRGRGVLVARNLAKIVIRLYAQSDDKAIKRRCLDAIDTMEQEAFFGLSGELERLDR